MRTRPHMLFYNNPPSPIEFHIVHDTTNQFNSGYQEWTYTFLFELYCSAHKMPCGVLFMVECAYSNTSRTIFKIGSFFSVLCNLLDDMENKYSACQFYGHRITMDGYYCTWWYMRLYQQGIFHGASNFIAKIDSTSAMVMNSFSISFDWILNSYKFFSFFSHSSTVANIMCTLYSDAYILLLMHTWFCLWCLCLEPEHVSTSNPKAIRKN